MTTGHEPVRAPKKMVGLEAAPVVPQDSVGAVGNRGLVSNNSADRLLVRGKGPLPPTAKAPLRRGVFESVLGVDSRTRILETQGTPWRMICYLEIEAPFGEFLGTGWFVGPKTLITAGHCLHHKAAMGGWATSIRVFPGRDADTIPVAGVSTTNFSSVAQWIETGDADFDYGVLQLDQPLGLDLGFFAVAARSDLELADALVNISGYPSDKPPATQWFHANKIARVTDRRIFHQVDTYAGQSGSPVWVLDANNAPVAVGIHAYGVASSGFGMTANSAPRITAPVLANIKKWVLENP